MYSVFAKYGLAAHLALVAVAPLFLFPYWGEGTVATVLLWLSVFAFVWSVMDPETRGLEMPHEARRRVVRRTFRDPLFWTLLTLIFLTGIRALNNGIALKYDGEIQKWYMADAGLDFYPGSVGGAGYLPFAITVAFTVVVFGCRQSLGRIGRSAFLLLSSALAGLASIIVLILINQGHAGALKAITLGNTVSSYLGVAMGIYWLLGTTALVTAFENRWNRVMPFFVLSIGGTAVGMVLFAPTYVSICFAGAEVLLLGYSFLYAAKTLRGTGNFRFLVVFAISFALIAAAAYAIIPEKLLLPHVQPFADGVFFPTAYGELKNALTGIAFRAWKTNPWFGTGVGSFAIDIRFFAQAEDWEVLIPLLTSVPSGYWQMLVEYGIVGCVIWALPFGFLFFTYGARLVRWAKLGVLTEPASWLLPVAFGAVIAVAFFDVSWLRPEVIIGLGALAAVSANAFPKERS